MKKVMKKEYIKPSIKKYPVNLSKCMLAASGGAYNEEGEGPQLIRLQTHIILDDDDDDDDSDF